MPKVWESCITLGALICVLAIGIVIFKASVHVPMFLGVCVAAVMALYLGHKWDSIEKMISMLEPAVVAVLAVAVGLVLLAVMLPLAGILSTIGV